MHNNLISMTHASFYSLCTQCGISFDKKWRTGTILPHIFTKEADNIAMVCIGQSPVQAIETALANLVLMNRRLVSRSLKGQSNFLEIVHELGSELLRVRAFNDDISSSYYWELATTNEEAGSILEFLRSVDPEPQIFTLSPAQSVEIDKWDASGEDDDILPLREMEIPKDEPQPQGQRRISVVPNYNAMRSSMLSRTISFHDFFLTSEANRLSEGDYAISNLSTLERLVGGLIALPAYIHKDFRYDLEHDVAELTGKQKVPMDPATVALLNAVIPSSFLKSQFPDYGQETESLFRRSSSGAGQQLEYAAKNSAIQYLKAMDPEIGRSGSLERLSDSVVLDLEERKREVDEYIGSFRKNIHGPTLKDFMSKRFSILDKKKQDAAARAQDTNMLPKISERQDSFTLDEGETKSTRARNSIANVPPAELSEIIRAQWRNMVKEARGSRHRELQAMLDNADMTTFVDDMTWMSEEDINKDLANIMKGRNAAAFNIRGQFVAEAVAEWYFEVKRTK
ncbi:hypothetical protein BJ742DRAFT_485772 [Cladochytrium replicatum]|nr:hypothetical protein BJ742DRAFT_485772 [Cladochytrium replicatum]